MGELDDKGNDDGTTRRTWRDPDASILALGAALFLDSFLPWYRVRFAAGVPASAAGSPADGAWGLDALSIAAVLIGVAAATLAGLRLAGIKPSVAVRPGAAFLIAGAATFTLTLLRYLITPQEVGGFEVLGFGASSVTRGIGMHLALLISVAMLVVGLRAYDGERLE